MSQSEQPTRPALDELDKRLLDVLQKELPLVERPFAAVGERAGVSEEEAIARLGALKARTGGVIRQISAIFDSRSLGYESCLVAAEVDEHRIEEAAKVINEHPGVSHNYRRNHAFNLWYTVAVPPDSRLGLERTVEILHARSGAKITRLMPALRVFKIGVKFSLGDAEAAAPDDAAAPPRFGAAAGFVASDADKRMIRVLQQDLPVVAEPFAEWARQAGVSVPELLEAARSYIKSGVMRRFSAVLRHRQAGFGFNAMGAWVVPSEEQEFFGNKAAGFAAVSHCYLRPAYPPQWPYSLFTMVHGREKSECESVMKAIEEATGITEHASLYSTHEFKKVRVKYFAGDIEAWEEAALRH